MITINLIIYLNQTNPILLNKNITNSIFLFDKTMEYLSKIIPIFNSL